MRLESFDSNKSYCSDEGAKSEASITANDTDDSSVDDAASLKLSDVFDNYEMASDNESTNMKPSLRKVRFQDSYGNSTTKNLKQLMSERIKRERNTLPKHLESLLDAFSRSQEEIRFTKSSSV